MQKLSTTLYHSNAFSKTKLYERQKTECKTERVAEQIGKFEWSLQTNAHITAHPTTRNKYLNQFTHREQGSYILCSPYIQVPTDVLNKLIQCIQLKENYITQNQCTGLQLLSKHSIFFKNLHSQWDSKENIMHKTKILKCHLDVRFDNHVVYLYLR